MIREASEALRKTVGHEQESEVRYFLSVQVDGAEWLHDTVDEFFADYHRSDGHAVYQEELKYPQALRLQSFDSGDVMVSVASDERSTIESVFGIFEDNVAESRLPEVSDPGATASRKPVIFVGHGRSSLWLQLKNHLQDQHNHEIVAYEIGARAGHEIRDILQDMLDNSSLAILCLTGEDETVDGELQPRLNVVHELGLFQGHLGFKRAIALVEEGTKRHSRTSMVYTSFASPKATSRKPLVMS